MSLVSTKDMLLDAKAGHYAVGHFNMNGVQWVEAILQAANEEKSPVIIASSDRVVDYLGGFRFIAAVVKALKAEMKINVPVALHLDHGQSVARCKEAVDAGYTSVMIDGSHFPIAENVRMTKEVVDYAHAKGVTVEAEVGTVGGNEDGLISGIQYASVADCVQLVQVAGVDSLAAALGSVHGEYQGEPKLGFAEMQEIAAATQVPLVLHGASGIPDYQLQKAIAYGHAKININTENNQAWAKAVAQVFQDNPGIYDPQSILTPGKQAIAAMVKSKIQQFGSIGKA